MFESGERLPTPIFERHGNAEHGQRVGKGGTGTGSPYRLDSKRIAFTQGLLA